MRTVVSAGVAIGIVSLLSVNVSFSQEHCVSALRIGAYDYLRANTSVANTAQAHSEFCNTYNRYESDKVSGGVKASYSLFSGSASFSRHQIESLGTMLCKSDSSNQTAQDVQTYASAAISQSAMEAYQRCLELNRDGLRVDVSLRQDDQGAIAMTLAYVTGRDDRPKITGLSIDPSGEFTCSGTLWDATRQISEGSDGVVLNQATSMLCSRKIYDAPILVANRASYARSASILVETEAGAIRYHLPAIPVVAGPDELAELRKQIVPTGAIMLSTGPCPSDYYIDVTRDYDKRYLRADALVADAPTLFDSDGSHVHNPHTHSHTVTGHISEPAAGLREGSRGRGAAAIRSPISGNASNETHTHDGGAHEHSYVGLRLCQKVAAPVMAGN